MPRHNPFGRRRPGTLPTCACGILLLGVSFAPGGITGTRSVNPLRNSPSGKDRLSVKVSPRLSPLNVGDRRPTYTKLAGDALLRAASSPNLQNLSFGQMRAPVSHSTAIRSVPLSVALIL